MLVWKQHCFFSCFSILTLLKLNGLKSLTNARRPPRSFKRKLLIAAVYIIVILLFLFTYSSCHKKKTQILTEVAVKKDLSTEVLASGTLRPGKETTVGAQVTARIEKLYVEVGDKVKEGQVIAVLDPTVAKNNLAKARNALKSEQAQLATLKNNLRIAKANYQSYRTLYQQGATSRLEYDRNQAEYKSTQEEIAQTRARIQQAELEVENRQQDVSYTVLRSPIEGVVVSLPVSVGQTLTAGYSTPDVAKIAQLDQMTIQALISEADIYNVKAGQKAYFTIAGSGEKKYQAHVKTVYPVPTTVSENNNNNGESNEYYAILNVDQLDPNFRAYMTTTVHIITSSKKNVLTIPSKAVQQNDQGEEYVILVQQGKKEKRLIQTGYNTGTDVEVTSGLKKGDQIVTEIVKLENKS